MQIIYQIEMYFHNFTNWSIYLKDVPLIYQFSGVTQWVEEANALYYNVSVTWRMKTTEVISCFTLTSESLCSVESACIQWNKFDKL